MTAEFSAQVLRASHPLDLSAIDTSATPGFDGGKKAGRAALEAGEERLAELQEKLFAESTAGGTRSVLLVLQAMDTAGKGGIVSHVVGAVDPQGVALHAFKSPTDEEKAHDFLWRIRQQLPPAGRIGVFDRSHYEDVLIHRVRGFSTPEVIEERYGIIRDFEQELVDAGTSIVKVMLHIGADTQKQRLADRLADPTKHWKFNPGDLDERAFWPQYMEAYEIAIDRTDADVAPWYVIPADHKWYARLAVQSLLTEALEKLDLAWPAADYDVAAETARLAAS
ncbi:polyphosphate kinase 2 family protein [Schumannella sp. 10F1B-5-1]|uniref:polyphosphate kinase 2 family protein n=1 Tax=Schumannella sp. 10F1B-5-1 TaxID=2590780 RepID=UPI00113122D3|nr:polyphosphate kinase 2 family protein [Schumannella sp. 10F1B-5-1]TPW71541.1 polyphosphate kinase 2 family protein [Schumannella sp. 10F1B-5-1]